MKIKKTLVLINYKHFSLQNTPIWFMFLIKHSIWNKLNNTSNRCKYENLIIWLKNDLILKCIMHMHKYFFKTKIKCNIYI